MSENLRAFLLPISSTSLASLLKYISVAPYPSQKSATGSSKQQHDSVVNTQKSYSSLSSLTAQQYAAIHTKLFEKLFEA